MLVAVAVIVYAMFGDPLAPVFLHLDFGRACSHYGCPPVKDIWARSWPADVYLLAGGLIVGVAAGIAGAVFCATRPRSLATRAVEALGMLFYSMPAYLFGFGVLLLFAPSFGALPLPVFFHPLDYEAPLEDPWKFVFEPTFGLLPSPVFFHPQDYAAPLANPWRFFEANASCRGSWSPRRSPRS